GDHVVGAALEGRRGGGPRRVVSAPQAVSDERERGERAEHADGGGAPSPRAGAVRRRRDGRRGGGGRVAGGERLERRAHLVARREPRGGIAPQTAIDDRGEPRIDPGRGGG